MFGVWSLGCRVESQWFGAKGVGCRVEDFGFGILGLGFRVEGLVLRHPTYSAQRGLWLEFSE